MHGIFFIEWELFKEVTAGCIYLSIYCESTSEGSLGAVLLIINSREGQGGSIRRARGEALRTFRDSSFFICL